MNYRPHRSGTASIMLCVAGLFASLTVSAFFAETSYGQISKPTALLKGEIRSEEDQSVVQGLQVAIMKGPERVTTSRTNVDGKFTAIVQPGGVYRLGYSSPNFAYREDTITVPAADKYQEIQVRSVVMPLRDNQDLTPKQPVFAKGSSKIDPVVASRLDQLANVLRKNPRVRLEIAVYPDMEIRSRKDAVQQRLLDERSMALKSFFISRNVQQVTVLSNTTLSGSATMQAIAPKGKKGKKPVATAKGAVIAQSVKITGRLSS